MAGDPSFHSIAREDSSEAHELYPCRDDYGDAPGGAASLRLGRRRVEHPGSLQISFPQGLVSGGPVRFLQEDDVASLDPSAKAGPLARGVRCWVAQGTEVPRYDEWDGSACAGARCKCGVGHVKQVGPGGAGRWQTLA